jgi:ribose transport system substrate-binding protein
MRKNFMKKTLALFCVMMLAFGLVGCKSNDQDTPKSTEGSTTNSDNTANGEEKTEQAEKKTYGYITPGPDTWYLRNVEGFQMAAEKNGNEVIVLNSDYDASKEVSNIESLINQGVDGVCIFSFNETGAQIAAEKCAAAGIPVVATDSVGTVFKSESDVVAAIDFDWTEMGNNYAQWMAENHPNEKFAIITGNFESVPCQMLNEAFTTKAEELGNECVEIQEAQYDPSVAVNVAQDLISSGKEFSVIFVMNEDMAAAVIQMLENNNLLDQYTVIAQNGSPAGLPLIENGKLDYTISSSPGWEGLVSYLALDQYATGKSTKVEQSILLPIMPVTQENIKDETKVVSWEVNENYWTLTEEYFPDLLK